MDKLSALLISVGLALSGFFIGNSIIEFKKDRTIEVRGLAEQDVKSTEASWDIRFRSSAPDITTLNVNVASSQKAIRDFLIKEGFSKDEIRSSSVTVNDNGQYGGNYDRQSRYSANGGIIVVTDKVDMVDNSSSKTDSLLASDVLLESSNIRFSYSKLNDIKPAMLQEATTNAREAAEKLAADSGVSLGKLRLASQGLFSIITPGSDSDDWSAIQKRVRVVSRVVFDIN